MKLRLIRSFAIWVVVVYILTGCSVLRPKVSRELDSSFREMVSIGDMNANLKATVLDIERGKYGADINILIENMSDSPIYFSVDEKSMFVKIYIVQNNEWVEVSNKAQYFSLTGGEGAILMPDKNKQPNFLTTIVRPGEISVENQSEQVVFRILFAGEFMVDDQKTGVPVGAYVDAIVER